MGGNDPGDDGEPTFSDFVRTARPLLLRGAFLLTQGQVDAEDLVQETLLLLFRHWGRMRHAQALAYARRTMYHFFVSEHRHRRWQRETLCAPADIPNRVFPDSDASPTQFGRLVADLPPRQRDVIIMRFAQDLSVAETAQLLGCRPPTVRSQQTRALRTLRAQVGALLIE